MVKNRRNQKSAGADYSTRAIRGLSIFTSLALPGATGNITLKTSRGRFRKWRHSIAKPRALTSKIGAKVPGVSAHPPTAALGLRDPPNEVFLLEFGFRPDGEGVQEV